MLSQCCSKPSKLSINLVIRVDFTSCRMPAVKCQVREADSDGSR